MKMSREVLRFIFQFGLLDAVSQVFPKAHHRWCARHIEANWSKAWKGVQMKKLLWWSAWCTYEEEFHDQLKVMGDVSKQAAKDLIWYPAQNWCRAYFDTVCKNHSCENNFTESFNKWILEARAKPIIKMLENIRIKLQRSKQPAQDVPVSASKASQEESGSVFMPTPDFIVSSSQQSSQPAGPSKSKRKIVADESEYEQHVAPSSVVADEDGGEHESENEQTILRPKAISEARTRLQAKKIQIRSTGTRRIGFKGDDNGVSIPTNLSYSPRKLAWKGKKAMTSNQLTVEKETRIGKLKAKKGKEATTSDQLTIEKEKRIGKLKQRVVGRSSCIMKLFFVFQCYVMA
ncbi:uncharacterized protein [Solanum tuberosum]|uniref:uncharacterized protein isoform X2 n=1 Tax=Solanum tuberosum TaxID=4113 RepID=UPI0003D27EEB|nr:PREDICTED: uncharacterized protein LOC102578363 isoform X2 [Solanum tuberosum]